MIVNLDTIYHQVESCYSHSPGTFTRENSIYLPSVSRVFRTFELDNLTVGHIHEVKVVTEVMLNVYMQDTGLS